MSDKQFVKAEKAFVEYIAELLKALYDLSDEDLARLAEEVAYKLEEVKAEYAAALKEVDYKVEQMASKYASYKDYYGLTDKQMATLIKGMVRSEYNQAKSEFEDKCAEVLKAINNMTLDDYRSLNEEVKSYRRELEDKLDALKFEAYANILELCKQFEEFKVENGLTQKEAVEFVEDALNEKFGKASEAYEKFRVEYLKAKFNISAEDVAKLDKKMAEVEKYVEEQYRAIEAETANKLQAALAEINAQIPSDEEIVDAYTNELLGAIRKKLQ